MIRFIYNFLEFVNTLEPKKLYNIMGAFLLCILSLTIFVMIYYYQSVHFLLQKIDAINDSRTEIATILNKAQQTKQQQIAVDQMLAEDPNFKIGDYCEKTLGKFQLNNKGKCSVTESTEREDNYLETRLTIELIDMSMKELAELLQELEKSPRIFTKELEINKSKKSQHAIDVKLVIGTLQPKTTNNA